MIVSLIFTMLSALCNSLMDAIAHHNVFNHAKKFWRDDGWELKYTWEYKYVKGVMTRYKTGRVKWSVFGIKFNKPVQFTDAFHLFKTIMLVFIFLAILSPFVGYTYDIEILKTGDVFNGDWWNIFFFGCLWYMAWNWTFLAFYKYIWKWIYKQIQK